MLASVRELARTLLAIVETRARLAATDWQLYQRARRLWTDAAAFSAGAAVQNR